MEDAGLGLVSLAEGSYESYDGGMTSPAVDYDDTAPPVKPSKRRHLSAVPDEFVNTTAATSGASRESVLEALAAVISLDSLTAASWPTAAPDFNPTELLELLRVSESLSTTFRVLNENLRAIQGTVVASSEVRNKWAHYLERVHGGGELLYISHHGERVAALVPAHVADFYKDAEDRADAAAIDQAKVDREAGAKPIPLEDLAEELGL